MVGTHGFLLKTKHTWFQRSELPSLKNIFPKKTFKPSQMAMQTPCTLPRHLGDHPINPISRMKQVMWSHELNL